MIKLDRKSAEKKRGANRRGFTLVELMISILVFVIFLSAASDSYISIIRAQKQTNEIRKMYAEVRSFTEMLAEDLRLSSIDYECYLPPTLEMGFSTNCPAQGIESLSSGMTNVLHLANRNGFEKKAVVYNRDEGTVEISRYVKILNEWQQLGTEPEKLFSGAVKIKNLSFAIFPVQSPYSGESEIYLDPKKQFQPKVTVFLTAANAYGSLPEFNLDYQTTISSRVYNR